MKNLNEVRELLLQEAKRMKEFGLELSKETFEILENDSMSNQELYNNFCNIDYLKKEGFKVSDYAVAISVCFGNNLAIRKYRKANSERWNDLV